MSNTILSATKARENLYNILADVIGSHKPVTITSKSGNAVLVSEEDWSAIQETLYLLSIPGMRESIQQGLNTNESECKKDLDW